MTTLQKFLWGGVGGLAPVVMTGLVADASSIANALQYAGDQSHLYQLFGYILRAAGLFLVGGAWAYLQRSEQDPLKVFQLGIVAPAMISGLISAGQVPGEKSGDTHASLAIGLFAPAYAQTLPPAQPTSPSAPPKTEATAEAKTPPQLTPWGAFLKGLTGQSWQQYRTAPAKDGKPAPSE